MPSLLKSATTYSKADNLPYDDASPNQVIDLYVPNNGSVTRPLIIWVHGGGWLGGDENSGVLPIDTGMWKRGFAVASVRYRLSQEATWPAQLVDVKAAIRYLRAHAPVYGIYQTKFGIWGASAGGHLAAMCAATNGVAKFDVGSYSHTSSAVTVCNDHFGPTNLTSYVTTPGYTQYAAPTEFVSKLLGAPVLDNPDLAADASPVHWVSPTSAPALIWHGTADPIVPIQQSRELKAAYVANGVPVVLIEKAGAGHGWTMPASEIQSTGDMFDGWLRP